VLDEIRYMLCVLLACQSELVEHYQLVGDIDEGHGDCANSRQLTRRILNPVPRVQHTKTCLDARGGVEVVAQEKHVSLRQVEILHIL
jgi:hypothetical protein